MKLVKCTAKNFASYSTLTLDFNAQGLTLIQGATGSGKSTILDMVSWALYGVTAKDGNVDEVKSWNSLGELTETVIEVIVSSKVIYITRRRGTSTQNDLFWTDEVGQYRGKNINETQTMLEQVLQCTREQYLTGAYFHEFSRTGAFFLAKAKDRRTVFENIADLKLPSELAEKATERKKELKKLTVTLNNELSGHKARKQQAERSKESLLNSDKLWEDKKAKRLIELVEKFERFEADNLKKIKDLEKKISEFTKEKQIEMSILEGRIRSLSNLEVVEEAHCGECGAVKNKGQREINEKNIRLLAKYQAELKSLSNSVSPHTAQLEEAKLATNEYHAQVLEKEDETSPFAPQIENATKEIDVVGCAVDRTEREIAKLTHAYHISDRLNDVSFELRGELLRKVVKQVEEATNRYLHNYFDSELRVEFSLDSDDLETVIYKNGNQCVYSQLSKGQRGLLKLTFAVSIMEAASNAAGVNFNALFFDESLDGYDAELKVKAYRLFQDLSLKHENVYVIDHSEELKSLFDNQITVTMTNDVSSI